MAEQEIASASLTAKAGFAAMRSFLEAYWERGGKASDDIAVLLGSLAEREDDTPLDTAQWHDWLDAIQRTG